MAFIKIPVYWYNGDPEKDELLNKDSGQVIDDLWFSTEHLTAYSCNDEGLVMLRLDNGEVFNTPLDYKQFIEQFPQLLSQLELVISNDN